jgi:hypothetical protein
VGELNYSLDENKLIPKTKDLRTGWRRQVTAKRVGGGGGAVS